MTSCNSAIPDDVIQFDRIKFTSASPAGHGAPKATEHSGGSGIIIMGTAVDTIHNTSRISSYALPLVGIYCYMNGYVSGSWWYATTHLPVEAADNDGIPLHNDRMSSRSFVFRKFLCAPCEIL